MATKVEYWNELYNFLRRFFQSNPPILFGCGCLALGKYFYWRIFQLGSQHGI